MIAEETFLIIRTDSLFSPLPKILPPVIATSPYSNTIIGINKKRLIVNLKLKLPIAKLTGTAVNPDAELIMRIVNNRKNICVEIDR